MPIYEYQCESCGYQHEALQKISDPLLTTCPKCGQESLKKLISAAGFRLSGSGWYETDFKSGNQRNLAQKDSANKDSSTAKPKKDSSSKSSSGSAS